jgi:hypothetical protein
MFMGVHMFVLRQIVVNAAIIGSAAAAAAAQEINGAVCKPQSALVSIPSLPEASGLAIGSSSNRLWMHNDSGAPELVAVDVKGAVAGRLTLRGAQVEDWEALAAGPCGTGRCLYVGDIGDNNAKRKQITIYRLPEPDTSTRSVQAEAFHASYPDGAHDAEALLVAPDGSLFVITKGDTGPIAVYKFPREMRAGATAKLERVGRAIAESPGDAARITDGAFSADGRWVVLRTNSALIFYRGDAFMRGDFREVRRVDISGLKEPQGEAVVFGSGNTVYLGGEGGGGKRPGTLAALSCAP